MSGSIGGRHQHSQAARTAIQRPIPSDGVADCYCGLGPQADDGNPFDGNPSGANYTPCADVVDMRTELTVIDWDNDYTELLIDVRETVPTSYKYRLRFIPSGPGTFPTLYPNGDWTLEVINAGGTTTLGGPTNQAHPVAGDVIELSAIGTAVVASINGSPLFSVTDSSYSPTTTTRMRVIGVSTSVVAGYNIVWEDFCP